ncbi:hypothetical protein Hanom_Chr00s000006g01614231 [Helianthus anomalus]
MKEAHDNIKSEIKHLEERNIKHAETNRFLEANYKDKQLTVNYDLDQIVVLKHELAETDKKNKKLQCYYASLYILECIFNISPYENDSEKKNIKKGIASEYHQVLPPMEGFYTFYDDEKVEKAINMVDHLPEKY